MLHFTKRMHEIINLQEPNLVIYLAPRFINLDDSVTDLLLYFPTNSDEILKAKFSTTSTRLFEIQYANK